MLCIYKEMYLGYDCFSGINYIGRKNAIYWVWNYVKIFLLEILLDFITN